MTKNTVWALALSIALPSLMPLNAMADVTSPSIKDQGKRYTNEKPMTSYYGTGSSGRLVEASELRMVVDDMIAAGEFEKAIPKAKKAVQLDPGDPTGHLFLARALTQKFYQSKGEIDEKLLAECVREWEIIRRHDADPTEQWEAGNQSKKLVKIAKALEKDKQRKEKEKLKEQDEDAKSDAIAAGKNGSGTTVAETSVSAKVSDGTTKKSSDRVPVALKRLFGM
ncbi:MAG: tetratricopeptide repeat protein [Candidatus Obscuribacterales bacterium]|nr:tetratricopeptide repeat protein [Candidatus Obscuribacterales bacterium]